MDDISVETEKLLFILKDWDVGLIQQYLCKYKHESSTNRMLSVLEDFFRIYDGNVSLEVLDEEVKILKELFPEYTSDYIMSLLKTVPNEQNRLQIIIRFLVNDKRNGVRKRESMDYEYDVPLKKMKFEINNDENAEKIAGQSSSLESNSTLPYTPLDAIYDNFIEGEMQPLTDYDYDYTQPSTSGLNNQIKLNYQQQDDLTDVSPVHPKPISEDSQNSTASTSENQEFNLYSHLQEMFITTSEELIRSVCAKYKVNPNVQPPGYIMNNIVSKLLSREKKKEAKIKADVLQEDPSPKPMLEVPDEKTIIEDPILIDDNTDSPEIVQETEMDKNDDEEDTTLVYPLMEMFPDACPQFIRDICAGRKNSNGVIDELISEILENDYPRRVKSESPVQALDPTEQLEIMKSILVDADPDYLQMHCDRLINQPDQLKDFIETALEERNYPTVKEVSRLQQISAQQKQYTTDFSVEKFLEVIPNPFVYFKDREKKTVQYDYQSHHYALYYLRNKFNKLPLRTIRECFAKNKESFLDICSILEKSPVKSHMKSKRTKISMPKVIANIPLLQEIAFYEHQDEILKFMADRELEEEIEKAQTKAAGLMLTCSCCFDDEVMPKHIVRCDAGCLFCKSCVQKSIEVAFGDGKLDFNCLTNCSQQFSLQVLQAVLSPKVFSTIALKKQVQEVKAAGIEDLETCPFCDFATIPARDDKLFRCLNPECMKESCRSCKEPSHVPLRCDEVEKDADVKARTYIENKMTEALLRTCYKCGMKFIKEDGCNKMTCSCGALMCYVCGKPVKDYKHFNGLGGDNFELCPLYSDTNQLHRDAVLKGAEEAKTEIGVTDSQLKINPAADIQNHYKSKQNQNHIPPVNPFNQLQPREFFLQHRALLMFQAQGELGRRRVHHRRHHRENL